MAGTAGGCVMDAPVFVAGCARSLGAGGLLGSVPLMRPSAGMCARRRTFFSCVAKKRRQKKATPSLRPLRFAAGQTCVGALAGCAVELALLLRSAARTTTASQMTKHGRFDAHATPQPPRRRRSQQGWDSRTSEQPDIHTGHCFAALRSAPSRGRMRHALRKLGRAQRWPVWLFGGSPPSGCAGGGALAG